MRYAIAAAEMSAGEVDVTQLIVSPSVLEKKSNVAEQLLVGREALNRNAAQHGSQILSTRF